MALIVNRTYTLRTTRLLSEYLAQNFRGAKIITGFRLGSLDPALLAQVVNKAKPGLAGVTRGYVDAVVVSEGAVTLWEAKNQLNYAALGQLEGYLAEWPNTPEAAPYAGMPTSGALLVAYSDPNIAAVAAAKGLQVVEYRPGWYVADQLSSEQAGANLAAAQGKTS
jgi:hypothetical protein